MLDVCQYAPHNIIMISSVLCMVCWKKWRHFRWQIIFWVLCAVVWLGIIYYIQACHDSFAFEQNWHQIPMNLADVKFRHASSDLNITWYVWQCWKKYSEHFSGMYNLGILLKILRNMPEEPCYRNFVFTCLRDKSCATVKLFLFL
jgi:hypothetical protein